MPRKPPARRPRTGTSDLDPKVARIAGFAALGGLLVVLIIVIVTLASSRGNEPSVTEARPTQPAQVTPAPTVAAKPSPAPRKLSAAERQQRALAAGIVEDRGFTVTRLADFDPRATLQVLIGRANNDKEMAFFFVDGEYIGNDASSTSRAITARRAGDDTSVALRYALADGKRVTVAFRWDGTRLTPSAPVPSAAERG